MKKKLSLCIRAFFSLIHIAFVKLFNIKGFHSAISQDFALTTRIHPHDGGIITLLKHIHAHRNVVFEAEGGDLKIGEGCFFNNGCMIVSHESITIGEYTCFGPNVLVYDHDHNFTSGISLHDSGYKTAPVVIGKNVWIGGNSVILRGTVIGDNCVIGAGSVIKGIYEDGSIVVQKRSEEIKRLRKEDEKKATV
ncbi:MAG: acyltransferase [Clostridia bacterium]|nr:acyltransferase [Clostridia bacterium]